MSNRFSGFTEETFQFLRDLGNNNNREWFEENRAVYEEHLLNPFKGLIEYLNPSMQLIDAGFELRPHRAMSRIYRDIRFSKNKTPYNDHLWLSFQVPVARGEWQNYPGYFIVLNEEDYAYGMGFGGAKRAIMDDFRDHLTYRAEEFKEKTQEIVFNRGFELGGEEYKRKLDNNLPEYFQPWIQRKTIWVMKNKSISENVFNLNFADEIKEDFTKLTWLYNFFKESQP